MPRNSKDNSLERFKLMNNVCEKYSFYCSYPKIRLFACNETKNKIKYASHFVKTFRQTLSHLDPKYIEIIRNEFLDSKGMAWWENKYSRATFYRTRDKAVSSFLLEFPL